MTSEYIVSKCRNLKKKYKENDVFSLAEKTGIKLIYRNDFVKLRGMYAVILKNRFIFLNSNLSEEMMKITLAHELGHDVLHRDLAALGVLRDYMIIDMKLRPEYEANLFAAEFLIDDESILELSKEGMDIFSASKILSTDPNLVSLKMRIMREKGIKLNDTFYNPDFMK